MLKTAGNSHVFKFIEHSFVKISGHTKSVLNGFQIKLVTCI